MRIKFVKYQYWETATHNQDDDGRFFNVQHLKSDTFRIIAALRAWIRRYS